MKFKNWQNESIIAEVRIVVTSWWGNISRKRHKENWCDGNILYLYLVSGYTDEYIQKFHTAVPLRFVHFNLYLILKDNDASKIHNKTNKQINKIKEVLA